MDCWGIIPVKPFRAGKSRLAPLLGTEARAALNRHLFGRVLDAALGIFKPDRLIVVTADPLLLPLMRGQGLHAIDDNNAGLNAALTLATDYALSRRADAVAVLPCDLPAIRTDDVRALLSALGPKPACVIAPDEQEEGTNSLVLTPPDSGFFHFGPGSFQAHIEAARSRNMVLKILRRPAFARDLDTPEEYRRYAQEQPARTGMPA
jgi:2-phospho-L-lactate guanylyltransferase